MFAQAWYVGGGCICICQTSFRAGRSSASAQSLGACLPCLILTTSHLWAVWSACWGDRGTKTRKVFCFIHFLLYLSPHAMPYLLAFLFGCVQNWISGDKCCDGPRTRGEPLGEHAGSERQHRLWRGGAPPHGRLSDFQPRGRVFPLKVRIRGKLWKVLLSSAKVSKFIGDKPLQLVSAKRWYK